MAYTDKFIATDALITHLNTIIPTITDPAIKANYAGFLSVSAVTVFELAVKEIISDFATKKNAVFGFYIDGKYQRINGRIKLSDLKDEHVAPFGLKYIERFKKSLDKKEKSLLKSSRISIRSSYGNLVTCRHQYVHEGSPTLSYEEVSKSYENGKYVIECLYNSLKR